MLKRTFVDTAHVTPGAFVELLIYYGQTVLCGNVIDYVHLLTKFDKDALLRLCDSGALKFRYDPVLTGVTRAEDGGLKLIQLVENLDSSGNPIPFEEVIRRQPIQGFKGSICVPDVLSLLNRADCRKVDYDVLDESMDDIRDRETFENGTKDYLEALVPGLKLPRNYRMRLNPTSRGSLIMDTNVNWKFVNKLFANVRDVTLEHDVVHGGRILGDWIWRRRQLNQAAEFDADVNTSPGRSMLLRLPERHTGSKSERMRRMLDRFQEVEFAGRSFRTAFDDGDLTLSDIADIVEHPETIRFKSWIQDVDDGKELLREYDRYLTKTSRFLERLPARFAKILLFTGLGTIVGGAAGAAVASSLAAAASLAGELAVGALDEFGYSKLAIGWRPGQWVREIAKPAISKRSN